MIDNLYALCERNTWDKRSINRYLGSCTERWISDDRLENIVELFEKIDVRKIGASQRVFLLRSNSRIRSFIPNYDSVLKEVKKSLIEDGLDWKILLVGFECVF